MLKSTLWSTIAPEGSVHGSSPGAQTRSSGADHGEKSPVCGSIFELEKSTHLSFCAFSRSVPNSKARERHNVLVVSSSVEGLSGNQEEALFTFQRIQKNIALTMRTIRSANQLSVYGAVGVDLSGSMQGHESGGVDMSIPEKYKPSQQLNPQEVGSQARSHPGQKEPRETAGANT